MVKRQDKNIDLSPFKQVASAISQTAVDLPKSMLEAGQGLSKAVGETIESGDWMGFLKKPFRQAADFMFESPDERQDRIFQEKAQKESNKLIEGGKGHLTSLPQDLLNRIRKESEEESKIEELAEMIPMGAVEQVGGGVTTKILNKLKGKTTVSKQFISDLTNMPELKQVERDLTRSILKQMPEGKVNVDDFARKLGTELLPLKSISGKTFEYPPGSQALRYENISLSPELRGNIVNYDEIIYQSPINTTAGASHFSGADLRNYFAHARAEDLAKGSTRRVIEIQSDLFQKGGLEKEIPNVSSEKLLREYFKPGRIVEGYGGKDKVVEFRTGDSADIFDWDVIVEGVGRDGSLQGQRVHSTFPASTEINKFISENRKLFTKEFEELVQLDPYRNTWHERIIKEEIKRASTDGKTRLQFPTGETAMKIEGLGATARWQQIIGRRADNAVVTTGIDLTPDTLKVGVEIRQAVGQNWVITDVLGNGKFKAVEKSTVEANGRKIPLENISESRKETFDISGKIDADNPIYKFYEKDVAKYLKRIRPEARKITDPRGVTWWEIPIKETDKLSPVEAFGAIGVGAGIMKEDNNQDNSIFNKVADYLKPQAGRTRPIDVVRELPSAIYKTQGGPQLEASAKTLGEAAFATFPSKEYKELQDRGDMTPEKTKEILPSSRKSLGRIFKELAFGISGPLGLASTASYFGQYPNVGVRVEQPVTSPTPVEHSRTPVYGEVLPKKIIKPSVAKHLFSDMSGQVDYALTGKATSGRPVSAAAKEILRASTENIADKEQMASIIKQILAKHNLASNKAVMDGMKNTLSNFKMFANSGINPYVFLTN